jgi:hypothetical protein
MRWNGDETQARAEAEDCIILLLPAAAARLSPTPTRRHLFGLLPPALVTEHLPFLSLFSYPFRPFVLFPDSLCTVSTATELPNRPTPTQIPDRGKFDQILYNTWPLKLSLIYILPGNCHPLFLSPTYASSLRCPLIPVSARTVTVTLISDDQILPFI